MMIKGKIEETFRSKNLTSIPPAQQRVIFCGQILTPETLKVKEIQNIADGTVSLSFYTIFWVAWSKFLTVK